MERGHQWDEESRVWSHLQAEFLLCGSMSPSVMWWELVGPSSSMSAVAVTTAIVRKEVAEVRRASIALCQACVGVWSGSHFILTVSTEKEMLVDARFRGGKLRPAHCHSADLSKLGWDSHLSWEH